MYFDLVSRLLGLPTGLLASLCMVESNHKNVLNPNDGGSPSYGICQIKYRTAQSVDPKVTKKQLMNPDTNIWLAGLHLKTLYNKQKSVTRALCQYNTGKPHNSCKYARKVISEWYHSKCLNQSGVRLNPNNILSFERRLDALVCDGRNVASR